jgi:hypothetical protein
MNKHLLSLGASALLAVAVPVRPALAQVSVGGYLEAFYSWNANDPANGVTALRGFDNRHNSFSLANAVVDVSGARGTVTGHLVLQVGTTPNTYYLAEPGKPAEGGAGASDADAWRFIQQANIGWRPSAASPWLVEAGIFLSPVGYEGMAVKDNFNFSRSNLFYGLPFYHTGARAAYAVSPSVKLVGAVYNGWNSVVDNNSGKSVSLQAQIARGSMTGSVLYFGGTERSAGAAEGQPWRHLLDAWVGYDVSPGLSVALHGDVGTEANSFGTSSWTAAAAYARVRAAGRLFLAGRADWFQEKVPAGASTIFWPATSGTTSRVASFTLTADYRPADQLSLRLEARRDDANGDFYYRDAPATDPVSGLAIPNASGQTTITLGLVTWF